MLNANNRELWKDRSRSFFIKLITPNFFYEITLEPLTDSRFYNNAESYPLQISRDGTGAVTQLLVLCMDVFIKIKE